MDEFVGFRLLLLLSLEEQSALLVPILVSS